MMKIKRNLRMMNKLYKEKLAYLRDNPDKVKEYAGYVHNGMFRKCKKCNAGRPDILSYKNKVQE